MSETAPDGSPVDLYAQLPERGEGEIVARAVRPGTEILELGSGAGRITAQLLARYRRDADRWRHPFAMRVFDEDGLRAALAEAGLQLERFLDDRGSWLTAVRAPRARA